MPTPVENSRYRIETLNWLRANLGGLTQEHPDYLTLFWIVRKVTRLSGSINNSENPDLAKAAIRDLKTTYTKLHALG